MSLIKVTQEKSNTVFKKRDILVYVAIIVVIVLLFVLTFCLSSKSELNLIEVYYNDNLIMTYSFSEDSLNYAQAYQDSFTVTKDGDIYTIGFLHNSQKNVFTIDKSKKVVKMIDANCSVSKDCKSMQISSPNDLIICVPNGIVIKAVGKDELKDPIIG